MSINLKFINIFRQKPDRPKKPKAEDKEKKGGWNSGGNAVAKAAVVPKIRSRIDTNFVKLKILDASRLFSFKI